MTPSKPRDRASEPFGVGSISFKPYAHDELEPVARLDELFDQLRLAERAGFDGVVMSEHHNHLMPGYLPNPLTMMGWALAELDRAWAAPCPFLLLLRPTMLVAEELAWLAARFPGRVGAGFAAGWSSDDFALVNSTNENLSARFTRELTLVTDVLRGRNPHRLSGDAAVARLAEHPLTVLSGAMSSVACRRAASLGCGILTDSQVTVRRSARFNEAYVDAGGFGPRVMVRRVWIGEPPLDLLQRQLAIYASRDESKQIGWGTPEWAASDQMIVTGSGEQVATQLATALHEGGGTALNLRLHMPGLEPVRAREQLERIGAEMIPHLRRLLESDVELGARASGH